MQTHIFMPGSRTAIKVTVLSLLRLFSDIDVGVPVSRAARNIGISRKTAHKYLVHRKHLESQIPKLN